MTKIYGMKALESQVSCVVCRIILLAFVQLKHISICFPFNRDKREKMHQNILAG